MALQITEYLYQMVNQKASDLHITANSSIQYRIDAKVVPADSKVLSGTDVKNLVYSFLTKEHIEKFERELELDYSFGIAGLARFRVNVFMQRGSVGCAIRLIPFAILNFEQCGLPIRVVTDFCKKPKGLVLITGSTGSGKSTTLASMVDFINSYRPCHIITIEDPIEFVHQNKVAIVDQREVFNDTHTFGDALKHVLRQDPDVILIGEMRDLETIQQALIIAETGHLVFATLHTSDCVQTINRIIDVFPAHQQSQIRTQLSFVLLGILSQVLVPKSSGSGRVLASEVLTATPAARSLIREGKVHQLYSVIQTSQREGMCTMNQALLDLYTKGVVTYDDCIMRSIDPEEFDRLVGSSGRKAR
ncbi:MAG: type IV pilus twitching motility protein PilT [Candidatus Omnitrophica bacterium]|nr:type IV pilus twitching motility protein PilT [Candidatus Omnitrophota bacterium]